MDKKQRVAAIIASGKTIFKEADAAALEALSDETLAAIEAEIAAEAVPPAPAPAPESQPAETVAAAAAAAPDPPTPQTEDEFLAAAPESIKQIVSAYKAAEAAKREGLVNKLKAAQKVYNEQELQAQPTCALEKLAALALKETQDFGALAPRAAASTDENAIPSPKSAVEAFGRK